MLSLVMEKTRAWELLNDPEYYDRLTVVGVQELMLQAGYSVDAVQRAVNQRGNERLDSNMVM